MDMDEIDTTKYVIDILEHVAEGAHISDRADDRRVNKPPPRDRRPQPDRRKSRPKVDATE